METVRKIAHGLLLNRPPVIKIDRCNFGTILDLKQDIMVEVSNHRAQHYNSLLNPKNILKTFSHAMSFAQLSIHAKRMLAQIRHGCLRMETVRKIAFVNLLAKDIMVEVSNS